MESVAQKLSRNLKQGTFFKNVPIALRNRFVKGIKSSNLFYALDKERVLTKKYQEDIKKLGSNGVKAGNYYLDSRVPINDESVIYSLGILTEISFDLFMQENYGCKVFMYDPTPASVAFMESYKENELLKYEPIGVWTENTTLKFYEPRFGGSASVMDDQASDKYFNAECFTIESIMKKNGHDHIAVFKADIEGAALPILNQMIEKEILPDQIVAEFERPQKDTAKINSFFKDLSELRSKLNKIGYDEYLLPRQKALYFSLELLFVKKTAIKD